jgi:uncharacterized phage protein (TIGR01671 family)
MRVKLWFLLTNLFKTMTREIKYRAWNISNKTMSNVTDITGLDRPDSDIYKYICTDNYGNGVQEWGNVELMQFTGLKYKNKKEICESDIIRDNVGRIWVVGFDEGSFVFEFVKNRSQKQSFDKFLKIQKPLVYLGNIHQNPELLNK